MLYHRREFATSRIRDRQLTRIARPAVEDRGDAAELPTATELDGGRGEGFECLREMLAHRALGAAASTITLASSP